MSQPDLAFASGRIDGRFYYSELLLSAVRRYPTSQDAQHAYVAGFLTELSKAANNYVDGMKRRK
jgi:hypothetical protein